MESTIPALFGRRPIPLEQALVSPGLEAFGERGPPDAIQVVEQRGFELDLVSSASMTGCSKLSRIWADLPVLEPFIFVRSSPHGAIPDLDTHSPTKSAITL